MNIHKPNQSLHQILSFKLGEFLHALSLFLIKFDIFCRHIQNKHEILLISYSIFLNTQFCLHINIFYTENRNMTHIMCAISKNSVDIIHVCIQSAFNYK